MVSIGTSLIAGAFLSILTLWIDQIRNAEQIRMAALIKTGLHTAHKRRNLPEYDSLVAVAKSIDVAGYTLKSFSEQNEDHFRSRVKSGNPIVVRILLVDPTTEAARAMEESEGLKPGTYSSLCESVTRKLGNIDGVSIRLLSSPLSMMVYRVDNFLYTGPFPTSGKSSTAFTLKIEKGGWLFDHQAKEFEGLWNKANID